MQDEPLTTRAERYLDASIQKWLECHEEKAKSYIFKNPKTGTQISKENIQFQFALASAITIGVL